MNLSRRCLAHMSFALIALLLAMSLAGGAHAQTRATAANAAPSVSGSPEALGAKAFLEGLIVKRFSLELATLVDRQAFSLGAQLELAPVLSPTAPAKTDVEPIADFLLGSLDAEQLLKSVPSPVEERTFAQKLLESFRIRGVQISVGLQEDLSPQTKTEVEQWLTKRLAAEYKGIGKGTVSFIKKVPQKTLEEQRVPKTIWDWLTQYQNFAGQLVLAISLLIGIFMWQVLARMFNPSAGADAGYATTGGSEEASDFESLAQAAAEIKAEQEQEDKRMHEYDEHERVRNIKDIETLEVRTRDLVPRLQGYLDDVIRTWCHMGEAGRLRLACFAEAAGKETGKLPIPVDALPDVQKVFARMPETGLRERREALEKAYWDLLSTLNLGSDSLSQPFAYMDGLSLNMVNRVLMDQNPKLKTLVSLYMNNDQRTRYVRSLSVQNKKELLMQAASLHEIRAEELEGFDRSLMTKINPTRGQEIVPLEMSFNKIVATLTPSEEVTLLKELTGDAIEEYKRAIPSLAFLHEWPDDKIKILMMGITPDELISYLRVRTDLKTRMLGLASMMVGEIAGEELGKPDKSSAAEKDKGIEFFNARVKALVEQNDINLSEIFGPRSGDGQPGGNNSDGNNDDAKRAA